jgi:hypothetical protein
VLGYLGLLGYLGYLGRLGCLGLLGTGLPGSWVLGSSEYHPTFDCFASSFLTTEYTEFNTEYTEEEVIGPARAGSPLRFDIR